MGPQSSSITDLDRVCMAQAVGSIQKDLGLDARQMSLVFGVFTPGSMLSEAPTGRMSLRLSPRVYAVAVWT